MSKTKSKKNNNIEYSSINVFLKNHEDGESVADQVCSELKYLPMKDHKRSYIVYTHDNDGSLVYVESFITDYKNCINYRVSCIVDESMFFEPSDADLEFVYHVIDMKTSKYKKWNKKKHKKFLTKVESLLQKSINSLVR